MPNYKNKTVRISAVKYINTIPFIYGIRKCLEKDTYSLELDSPAVCAEKLISDRADVGLVPVAAFPEIKNHQIISKYCIGAEGTVKSVKLFSCKPISKVKRIALDKNSRTSVALTQILAKEFWSISPKWVFGVVHFEKMIKDTTAAVVIGDKALRMNGKYPYQYDLAEEWCHHTGLPIVFACWVTNKKLTKSFISCFENALAYGLKNKNEALHAHADEIVPIMSMVLARYYLCNNISYELDERKKKGMELFRLLSESAPQ